MRDPWCKVNSRAWFVRRAPLFLRRWFNFAHSLYLLAIWWVRRARASKVFLWKVELEFCWFPKKKKTMTKTPQHDSSPSFSRLSSGLSNIDQTYISNLNRLSLRCQSFDNTDCKHSWALGYWIAWLMGLNTFPRHWSSCWNLSNFWSEEKKYQAASAVARRKSNYT